MDSENVGIKGEPSSVSSYALDDILRQIGKFGLYQLFVYFFICLGIILSSSYALSFVFTVGEVNYRCQIPECDNVKIGGDWSDIKYNPSWLSKAVPFEKDKPKPCVRYAFKINNTNVDSCASENFDKSVEVICTDVIFDDYENTIVNEFGLVCEENKWKISLVGTIHNTAHFLNLMISGYFSDKFGRKNVFIFSTICGGLFPIIRSFSWNYISFIIIEFIDTLLVAGVYTAGFILAVEIVRPELRAFGGVVIFCAGSIGKAVIGLVAWWLKDWQLLLRVNNAPALVLGVLYFFVLPESFRWLLAKRQNKKVAGHLLKAAKVNKIEISESMKDVLENRPEDILLDTQENQLKDVKATANDYNLQEVFQHPSFCLRIMSCAYCWLTNIFVFYGLSFTAVAIGGNKFSDWTYVSLIEIPATIFVICTADRLGRRFLLISAFFLSGTSLLVSTLVPEIYWVNLVLFLVGKFAITVSFSSIYTFTSEIFPTNLRHTLLGFCSGFGRLGSIIASQAPLLQSWSKHLPAYLFAGTALLAGILCFTFPETFKTKLPDTIDEAMEIGKNKIKQDK